MKTFVLIFGLIMALAVPVFAQSPIYKTTPFTSYTGLASTARYSTPFNTGPYTKKTIIVNGMYSSSTYGNFSGTIAAECSQAYAGPFVPCKDTAGNAVSATANGMFHMDNMAPWIRMKWTRTKHRISAWIYYSE